MIGAACSASLNETTGVGPNTSGDTGGQSAASIILTAVAAPADSRTFSFVAEIVGGADDDQKLYCMATTWNFGDGPAMTVTPSCAPWTAGMKIERRFEASHTYEKPGRYVTAFSYASLSTERVIDVR
jgi:hypothetical protein